MKINTQYNNYLIPIFIILVLLIGCGGRPISMVNFMDVSNRHHAYTQINFGDIVNEKSMKSDKEDVYVVYNEPYNIGGYSMLFGKTMRGGLEIGVNGISGEFGYINSNIGVMCWTSIGGFGPHFGAQAAYSIDINNDFQMGPILYYSNNTVISESSEYGSFTQFNTAYNYDEYGGGVYLLNKTTESNSLSLEYKIGNEKHSYNIRNYIGVSIGFY